MNAQTASFKSKNLIQLQFAHNIEVFVAEEQLFITYTTASIDDYRLAGTRATTWHTYM